LCIVLVPFYYVVHFGIMAVCRDENYILPHDRSLAAVGVMRTVNLISTLAVTLPSSTLAVTLSNSDVWRREHGPEI
jgi:hypothetical protein